MDNISDWIFVFRMGERIALSIIIVTISIVVMIGFWRSLQKIDLQMSREKIGAGGTVVLGTPIFVLLALIGYAFISLSNPISLEKDRGAVALGAYTGMTPDNGPGDGKAANNVELGRLRAVDKVKSLNCLAREAGEMSARIQDDLAAIKLQLLEPVWSEEWGNFEAFAAWALGRSQEAPHPGASAVFQELRQLC